MIRRIAGILIVLGVFCLCISPILSTQQEEEDPIKCPLKEGTYIVSYFEDIIRRTMSGSYPIPEEELTKHQSYYKIYYSKDYYKVTLIIERCERLEDYTFTIIQRFIFDSMGNVVKEQTFNFNKKLTSYTLYEFDSEGRILKESKYSGTGALRSEKIIVYNQNGTLLRIEHYSRGKLAKKEIYGDKNKLQKVYIYYYFPNGNMERKEEYNGSETIQRITYYDDEGKPLQKVMYENGEIKEIVNMQPKETGEELDLKAEVSASSYGVGIGPNIVVINEILNFANKYIDSVDPIIIGDRVFNNTNDDFIFALFYSQGIDLKKELEEDINNKKNCSLYYLWGFFENEGDAWGKDYSDSIRRGDLLFFDKVYDADGNGILDDPKTHAAIVESISPNDGTITYIHCKGADYGGIQRGKINLRARSKGDLNNPLGVYGNVNRGTNLLSGVAKPDYLSLKLER